MNKGISVIESIKYARENNWLRNHKNVFNNKTQPEFLYVFSFLYK